ncbi:hypothetical protein BESB_007950 [Besnoitia besnoiti]|uniref:Uncharacterized protein n=1 Tax=Besnoitia besnoiti TaxID=94643 RepID=A0A2A9MQE4_BESBE|nr:hypothetical protein BESB_007950 [Besnoitia besnoiti]PFH38453.1 hypothetical protein BESB_007950 [Besnoitia besnoiti]
MEITKKWDLPLRNHRRQSLERRLEVSLTPNGTGDNSSDAALLLSSRLSETDTCDMRGGRAEGGRDYSTQPTVFSGGHPGSVWGCNAMRASTLTCIALDPAVFPQPSLASPCSHFLRCFRLHYPAVRENLLAALRCPANEFTRNPHRHEDQEGKRLKARKKRVGSKRRVGSRHFKRSTLRCDEREEAPRASNRTQAICHAPLSPEAVSGKEARCAFSCLVHHRTGEEHKSPIEDAAAGRACLYRSGDAFILRDTQKQVSPSTLRPLQDDQHPTALCGAFQALDRLASELITHLRRQATRTAQSLVGTEGNMDRFPIASRHYQRLSSSPLASTESPPPCGLPACQRRRSARMTPQWVSRIHPEGELPAEIGLGGRRGNQAGLFLSKTEGERPELISASGALHRRAMVHDTSESTRSFSNRSGHRLRRPRRLPRIPFPPAGAATRLAPRTPLGTRPQNKFMSLIKKLFLQTQTQEHAWTDTTLQDGMSAVALVNSSALTRVKEVKKEASEGPEPSNSSGCVIDLPEPPPTSLPSCLDLLSATCEAPHTPSLAFLPSPTGLAQHAVGLPSPSHDARRLGPLPTAPASDACPSPPARSHGRKTHHPAPNNTSCPAGWGHFSSEGRFVLIDALRFGVRLLLLSDRYPSQCFSGSMHWVRRLTSHLTVLKARVKELLRGPLRPEFHKPQTSICTHISCQRDRIRTSSSKRGRRRPCGSRTGKATRSGLKCRPPISAVHGGYCARADGDDAAQSVEMATQAGRKTQTSIESPNQPDARPPRSNKSDLNSRYPENTADDEDADTPIEAETQTPTLCAALSGEIARKRQLRGVAGAARLSPAVRRLIAVARQRSAGPCGSEKRRQSLSSACSSSRESLSPGSCSSYTPSGASPSPEASSSLSLSICHAFFSGLSRKPSRCVSTHPVFRGQLTHPKPQASPSTPSFLRLGSSALTPPHACSFWGDRGTRRQTAAVRAPIYTPGGRGNRGGGARVSFLRDALVGMTMKGSDVFRLGKLTQQQKAILGALLHSTRLSSLFLRFLLSPLALSQCAHTRAEPWSGSVSRSPSSRCQSPPRFGECKDAEMNVLCTCSGAQLHAATGERAAWSPQLSVSLASSSSAPSASSLGASGSLLPRSSRRRSPSSRSYVSPLPAPSPCWTTRSSSRPSSCDAVCMSPSSASSPSVASSRDEAERYGTQIGTRVQRACVCQGPETLIGAVATYFKFRPLAGRVLLLLLPPRISAQEDKVLFQPLGWRENAQASVARAQTRLTKHGPNDVQGEEERAHESTRGCAFPGQAREELQKAKREGAGGNRENGPRSGSRRPPSDEDTRSRAHAHVYALQISRLSLAAFPLASSSCSSSSSPLAAPGLASLSAPPAPRFCASRSTASPSTPSSSACLCMPDTAFASLCGFLSGDVRALMHSCRFLRSAVLSTFGTYHQRLNLLMVDIDDTRLSPFSLSPSLPLVAVNRSSSSSSPASCRTEAPVSPSASPSLLVGEPSASTSPAAASTLLPPTFSSFRYTHLSQAFELDRETLFYLLSFWRGAAEAWVEPRQLAQLLACMQSLSNLRELSLFADEALHECFSQSESESGFFEEALWLSDDEPEEPRQPIRRRGVGRRRVAAARVSATPTRRRKRRHTRLGETPNAFVRVACTAQSCLKSGSDEGGRDETGEAALKLRRIRVHPREPSSGPIIPGALGTESPTKDSGHTSCRSQKRGEETWRHSRPRPSLSAALTPPYQHLEVLEEVCHLSPPPSHSSDMAWAVPVPTRPRKRPCCAPSSCLTAEESDASEAASVNSHTRSPSPSISFSCWPSRFFTPSPAFASSSGSLSSSAAWLAASQSASVGRSGLYGQRAVEACVAAFVSLCARSGKTLEAFYSSVKLLNVLPQGALSELPVLLLPRLTTVEGSPATAFPFVSSSLRFVSLYGAETLAGAVESRAPSPPVSAGPKGSVPSRGRSAGGLQTPPGALERESVMRSALHVEREACGKEWALSDGAETRQRETAEREDWGAGEENETSGRRDSVGEACLDTHAASPSRARGERELYEEAERARSGLSGVRHTHESGGKEISCWSLHDAYLSLSVWRSRASISTLLCEGLRLSFPQAEDPLGECLRHPGLASGGGAGGETRRPLETPKDQARDRHREDDVNDGQQDCREGNVRTGATPTDSGFGFETLTFSLPCSHSWDEAQRDASTPNQPLSSLPCDMWSAPSLPSAPPFLPDAGGAWLQRQWPRANRFSSPFASSRISSSTTPHCTSSAALSPSSPVCSIPPLHVFHFPRLTRLRLLTIVQCFLVLPQLEAAAFAVEGHVCLVSPQGRGKPRRPQEASPLVVELHGAAEDSRFGRANSFTWIGRPGKDEKRREAETGGGMPAENQNEAERASPQSGLVAQKSRGKTVRAEEFPKGRNMLRDPQKEDRQGAERGREAPRAQDANGETDKRQRRHAGDDTCKRTSGGLEKEIEPQERLVMPDEDAPSSKSYEGPDTPRLCACHALPPAESPSRHWATCTGVRLVLSSPSALLPSACSSWSKMGSVTVVGLPLCLLHFACPLFSTEILAERLAAVQVDMPEGVSTATVATTLIAHYPYRRSRDTERMPPPRLEICELGETRGERLGVRTLARAAWKKRREDGQRAGGGDSEEEKGVWEGSNGAARESAKASWKGSIEGRADQEKGEADSEGAEFEEGGVFEGGHKEGNAHAVGDQERGGSSEDRNHKKPEGGDEEARARLEALTRGDRGVPGAGSPNPFPATLEASSREAENAADRREEGCKGSPPLPLDADRSVPSPPPPAEKPATGDDRQCLEETRMLSSIQKSTRCTRRQRVWSHITFRGSIASGGLPCLVCRTCRVEKQTHRCRFRERLLPDDVVALLNSADSCSFQEIQLADILCRFFPFPSTCSSATSVPASNSSRLYSLPPSPSTAGIDTRHSSVYSFAPVALSPNVSASAGGTAAPVSTPPPGPGLSSLPSECDAAPLTALASVSASSACCHTQTPPRLSSPEAALAASSPICSDRILCLPPLFDAGLPPCPSFAPPSARACLRESAFASMSRLPRSLSPSSFSPALAPFIPPAASPFASDTASSRLSPGVVSTADPLSPSGGWFDASLVAREHHESPSTRSEAASSAAQTAGFSAFACPRFATPSPPSSSPLCFASGRAPRGPSRTPAPESFSGPPSPPFAASICASGQSPHQRSLPQSMPRLEADARHEGEKDTCDPREVCVTLWGLFWGEVAEKLKKTHRVRWRRVESTTLSADCLLRDE